MKADSSLVVDASWPFERVWQLEVTLYGEKAGTDPLGPVCKWQALHRMEKSGIRFLHGDRAALFEAIYQCATRDVLIPDWAARAFRRGYQEILNCRVDSWDEAFGPPFPKGFKISQAKRRRSLRPQIHVRIMNIIKQESVPVDDELFQRVATEFHIGKRQCKQFWYDMGGLPRNWLKKTLPP